MKTRSKISNCITIKGENTNTDIVVAVKKLPLGTILIATKIAKLTIVQKLINSLIVLFFINYSTPFLNNSVPSSFVTESNIPTYFYTYLKAFLRET